MNFSLRVPEIPIFNNGGEGYHSKDLTASISETRFSMPLRIPSTAAPSLNLTSTKCLNSPPMAAPPLNSEAPPSLYNKGNPHDQTQTHTLDWMSLSLCTDTAHVSFLFSADSNTIKELLFPIFLDSISCSISEKVHLQIRFRPHYFHLHLFGSIFLR